MCFYLGLSPLYQAIINGKIEICRLLVNAGADVNWKPLQNKQEMHGNTPLML